MTEDSSVATMLAVPLRYIEHQLTHDEDVWVVTASGVRGSTGRSGVYALVLAPSAAPASFSRTGVAPPRPATPIK